MPPPNEIRSLWFVVNNLHSIYHTRILTTSSPHPHHILAHNVASHPRRVRTSLTHLIITRTKCGPLSKPPARRFPPSKTVDERRPIRRIAKHQDGYSISSFQHVVGRYVDGLTAFGISSSIMSRNEGKGGMSKAENALELTLSMFTLVLFFLALRWPYGIGLNPNGLYSTTATFLHAEFTMSR